MRTVICHFYNEEYLLPWWLNHTKKFFDHGIMINYNSTDRSVEIIKELCPSWEIVDTENEFFDAPKVDKEVEKYEHKLTGWKCCLNVTEFIFGDFVSLENQTDPTQHLVPVILMTDQNLKRNSAEIDKNIQLYDQITTGVEINKSMEIFNVRSMHNYNIVYPKVGRHFKYKGDEYKFVILKFQYAPMTQEFIDRKLQIQYKLPPGDKHAKFHSDGGTGLTKEKILAQCRHLLKFTIEYKQLIADLKDKSNIK